MNGETLETSIKKNSEVHPFFQNSSVTESSSPKSINVIQTEDFQSISDANVFHEDVNKDDRDVNHKNALAEQREFSQMDIFVNQFIKPEIKTTQVVVKTTLRRRVSRRQTNLNLLIVGEQGLGKNTFIKYLIANNELKKDHIHVKEEENERSICDGMFEKTFTVVKDGQRINLNIIRVPEFGCREKSDYMLTKILNYVNETFKSCFKLECSLDRTSVVDKKIHCCLYFISPYGHSMKPLDIEFMKLFQSKLNIIPIIAKSDIFTKAELAIFRLNVVKDFKKHNINLFQYSNNCDQIGDEFDDIQEICEELKDRIPFTIISSNDSIMDSTKKDVAVRQYPWGIVRASDAEISNYSFVENILLKSHLNYFKTITKSVFYENYRVEYILEHVS